MFFQNLVINTGTIIISIHKSKRIKLHEIDITCFIFSKKNEVVCLLIDVPAIIVHYIKLTADDCFDLIFFTFFGKFQGSIHITVICHGNSIDPVLHAMSDKIIHLDGTVKKAVFRMKMQMYKISHEYSPRKVA